MRPSSRVTAAAEITRRYVRRSAVMTATQHDANLTKRERHPDLGQILESSWRDSPLLDYNLTRAISPDRSVVTVGPPHVEDDV